jgi:HAD superfamily hydrolase (TIGR01509 family)
MNPQRTPIRGVIFDMDGVLCDSEPFICEAACRMFAELYGTTVQAEDFLPFVGAGENRYLGGVAAKHGLTIDIDLAKRRTYEIYLQIIKGRLEPMHGVHEFVAECRRRGLKLAVATSADYVKMAGNLAEIRLPPERFDACINGLDVERKKPNPDIFLLAARRLGLPAEDCLVIEDAPNGVQAAKAAGSRCLGLTSSFSEGQLAACGADWIAPDLASVPDGVFEME